MLQELKNKIYKLLPELKETSFGCEVLIYNEGYYFQDKKNLTKDEKARQLGING